MAPKTTAELFGLSPQERNGLAILSGLEGYRGGGGKDVAAVAANVLARKLHSGYGGTNILNIATAPGQYASILDPKYTRQQLSDPNFGAKLFGINEFKTLLNIVDNPSLVRAQFEAGRAPLSFRGRTAYPHKLPTDYMPIPGKSNFYFDSDPTVLKKGLNIFNQLSAPNTTQVPSKTGQSLSQNIPVIPFSENEPTVSSLRNVLAQVEKGNNFGNLAKTQMLASALQDDGPNLAKNFLASYLNPSEDPEDLSSLLTGNLLSGLNIG